MYVFPQPLCEHMGEIPPCPKTYQPVCGTNEKTYNNECQLCIARMKLRQTGSGDLSKVTQLVSL
uniref:Kazal-like domain-containing protein n=1 Tax=Vombatus ursinus TaxID=29139 RepID=A0A4X2KL65_VOMUR